jgi:putative SOS response-associated peptidase YedK
MCGRYAITLPPEAVRGYFAYRETPNFPPRYNIAPTQPIPIVAADPFTRGEERHFRLMRWGFLPGFVKDPKTFPLIINARVEEAADKASFRNALKRRRCLVIADAFYEWRKEPGAKRGAPKRPYLIRRAGGEPMGFAGLYETYCDKTGGEIDTACILVRPANRLVSGVHDRMPAILERADFSAWLDCDHVDVPEALALLAPTPEDALELVEIGPAVNHHANDDPAVQAPLAAPIRGAPSWPGGQLELALPPATVRS